MNRPAPVAGTREIFMVTYEVRPGGPIVFSVAVDGFGPVTITSRRPTIFNGRLTNRPVLQEALRQVEAFVDEHRDELAPLYAAIAAPSAA
jgi:hypothetical protein